jgi:hypothetical protein
MLGILQLVLLICCLICGNLLGYRTASTPVERDSSDKCYRVQILPQRQWIWLVLTAMFN